MLRLILLFVVWLTLYGCGETDAPPPQNAVPEATNITIADLSELVEDRTITIEEPLIVGGYVTSSDKAENFYKTFTIEDATGGLEIMAGLYDLHNIYPIGYYVTLRLQGCSVAKHYEVLQVGRKAESHSNYPTEYFSSRILLDQYVSRYDVRGQIAPKPYTIKELQQSNCGRLVCVGGLRNVNHKYIELYGINSNGCWSGYNIFSDENGDLIAVYTSEYANYADNKVPNTTVTLTGILQYGKIGSEELFMIKMRDDNDCKSSN